MECKENKRKDGFTKGQWRHDSYRVCKECTAHKRDAGTPYRCSQCLDEPGVCYVVRCV